MNVMSDIKVIGIDPAPFKKSTVFDGDKVLSELLNKKFKSNNGFYEFKPHELVCVIKKIKENNKENNNNILICWDAPLTGPDFNNIEECKNNKVKFYEGNFSDRKIEKWLRLKVKPKEKKDPPLKTVTVRYYSGLVHWTITKYIFGLPEMGGADSCDNLPFQLLTDDKMKDLDQWNKSKNSIVEVHPAVAIYIIYEEAKRNCKKAFPDYKNNKEDLECLWGSIKCHPFFNEVRVCKNEVSKDKCEENCKMEININTHDELDALVAYTLGKNWVKDNGVKLIGDKNTGAMLLPDSIKCDKEDCKRDFETFLSNFKYPPTTHSDVLPL